MKRRWHACRQASTTQDHHRIERVGSRVAESAFFFWGHSTQGQHDVANTANPAAVGLNTSWPHEWVFVVFENVTPTILSRATVAELVIYIIMDDLTFKKKSVAPHIHCGILSSQIYKFLLY